MLIAASRERAAGDGECSTTSTIWAVIAAEIHLFPFRTEKLSPPAPMVLGAQAPGRVGRRPVFAQDQDPRVGILIVRSGEDARFAGTLAHAVLGRSSS